MKTAQKLQLACLCGCLVSVLLVVLGWLLIGGLPGADELHPDIRRPPVQREAPAASFFLEREGRPYQIQPVATFEMTALVVSRNNLDQESQDKLGLTRDIGVIWGENTVDDRFHDYDFSNSSWMLRVQVPPGVPFNMNEVANIHLVTADDHVADSVDDIEPGAQVRLRGRLINYVRTDLGNFKRQTSLTRDDTGNGACEVLLVEQVEVISNPNAKYALMTRIGGWGLLLSIVALIVTTLLHVWLQSQSRKAAYALYPANYG